MKFITAIIAAAILIWVMSINNFLDEILETNQALLEAYTSEEILDCDTRVEGGFLCDDGSILKD